MATTSIAFSVLLPVWAGDRPDYLAEAFHSAVTRQTLLPDEVVLVRDGPVPDELERCIDTLRDVSPVPVHYVPLEINRGLGPALDAGLRRCSHDVVARMDADDIAMPDRFEKQVPHIADADIVGAGLVEFSAESGDVVGTRKPPTGQDTNAAYAKVHDPFNHPTVVYRRSAIVAAGGYGDLPLMEDYWLFARMLANGARAKNLVEPLVYYRVGEQAYRRRGGATLLRSEIRLQRQFRDEGFINSAQYARNVAVRGGYRLVPWWARRGVYKTVVALYGKNTNQEQTTTVPPEIMSRLARIHAHATAQ